MEKIVKTVKGYITESKRKGQHDNRGEKEGGGRDHKPLIEPF
jgi:hypothetical protein